MKVSEGGGHAHDGECIEVLALPFSSADAFIADATLPKSPGAMLGLLWAVQGLQSGKLPGRRTLETGPLTLQPVLPS